MGIKDSFKSFIGLTDEYDDVDYEENEELYDEEPLDDLSTAQHSNSNSNRNNVLKIHSNSDMKLFICEPTKYDECTKAVDELKNRKAVVLNIESLELEDQRQIFEFVKGAVYALEASIQKVSKGIFVIAPLNVQIDGSETEKEKYEKNMYFQ